MKKSEHGLICNSELQWIRPAGVVLNDRRVSYSFLVALGVGKRQIYLILLEIARLMTSMWDHWTAAPVQNDESN